MPSPAQLARNRLGAAARRKDPPEKIAEARRDLRITKATKSFADSFAALAAEYGVDENFEVDQSGWPAPTPEKVQEIAEILHGAEPR